MTPDRDEPGPDWRPDRKVVHPGRIGIEAAALSADILRDDSMVIPPMHNDTRAERLDDLQRRVDRGEYRVDTHAVADAILRRLLGGDRGGGASPQAPCS